MGTTNVDVSGNVAAHVQLTAGEVQDVHFTRPSAVAPFYTPNPVSTVEIVNRSGDDVWYTTDGSVPVEEGGNCFVLPPGNADTRDMPSRQTNVVRLLSPSDGKVSVQKVS